MMQLKVNAPTELMKKMKVIESEILKGYQLPVNYTTAYYARRVEPYLSKPPYQEVLNPSKLYRGMYLSPDDLNTILQQGMKLDQVKWTAAGGGVSFSSNANEAATYIFHGADHRKNGIGVVFEIKMSDEMKLVDDPILNSTRTIFKKHADVSRDEITNVYLWGEYGLESFDAIAEKIKNGKITPHQNWTGMFDQEFSR